MTATEHIDVIVVGAGLSGIGAGYYLQERCPGRSYAILEGREAMGGTWDLFRYPGIRSDSDMHTLGFRFNPWPDPEAIADGPSILRYIEDTARRFGIDRRIRYQHYVTSADWSSAEKHWRLTVELRATGETKIITTNFLVMCSGYYDYDEGYTPHFEGREDFRGRVIHPQHWPEDLDYAGKRVVVIGSGATAVTLIPSLADTAEHVTMLQRTPTYVISRPRVDPIAQRFEKVLPSRAARKATRWKNIVVGQLFYGACKRAPDSMRKLIVSGVRKELGDDADVDTHFSPPYKPWDQRLCLVPDGDLFESLRAGKASVVTDHIDRFVPEGLLLRSGETLPADIVVTATGLKVQLFGGAGLKMDGRPIDLTESITYKAIMLSDVPNLAVCFGYTNASWTLKVDLTHEYVCRLLNHMERHDKKMCVARVNDPSVEAEDFVALTSGYLARARQSLPKIGSKTPWRLRQVYLLDRANLRLTKVDDGAMTFA